MAQKLREPGTRNGGARYEGCQQLAPSGLFSDCTNALEQFVESLIDGCWPVDVRLHGLTLLDAGLRIDSSLRITLFRHSTYYYHIYEH